jgi:hypothetical protein
MKGTGMTIETVVAGGQVFDVLRPEDRPQDEHGDGRSLQYQPEEHGGDEPDMMPQAIIVTDAEGRWAVYVPLEMNGQVVRPRRGSVNG